MSINATDMTAEQLANKLQIWDQTIGCEQCGCGWWADNYTPDPTMFHELTCPLFGRRDVAGVNGFNLYYVEKKLGRRVGIEAVLSDAPCPVCKNQKWGSKGFEPKPVAPERYTSALMHGRPCCRECFEDVAKWLKSEPFQGYTDGGK